MTIDDVIRVSHTIIEQLTEEKEAIKEQAASQDLDSPSRTMFQHRVTRHVGMIEGVQRLRDALMKEANIEPPI